MEDGERIPIQRRIGREAHKIGEADFTVSWTTFNPEVSPQTEQNSKKAIIFIPGWSIGEQTETVKPICELLAKESKQQTLAVKSRIEKPVRGLLPGNAEAIRLFIQGQGLTEVTLVGQSEGGAIAIALAARLRKKNPDLRVHGLVLLDPTSVYNQEDTELLSIYLKDIITTTSAALRNRGKLAENLTYAASGGKGIIKEFMSSGGFLGFINRAGHDVREMAKASPYLSEVKIPVVIAQGASDIISDPNKTTSDAFPNSPWVKNIVLKEWPLHNAAYVMPRVATEALSVLQSHNLR